MAVIALLFIPGYVTLVVWNRRQGWTPRPDLQLFATAVIISAFCHLPFFWLIPIILRWSHQGTLGTAGHSWTLLGWFLATAIVVPTGAGLLASSRLDAPKGKVATYLARIFPLDRVSRAPTAWDAIWSGRKGRFIVVKLSDGKLVGGKFGTNSAVAFWRDGHDLFLEEEWTVDQHGLFTADSRRIPASRGIWLSGSAVTWVRFVGGEE